MRHLEVEIYADTSNAAVIRHPSRRFPGCLIQGDSLYLMLQSLQIVCRESSALSEDAAGELKEVIEALAEKVDHYKAVLAAHRIDLPFTAGFCLCWPLNVRGRA